MKKKEALIYYIVTGLFTAFMVMGVATYVFANEMVTEQFAHLGFPAWLVYAIGTAKVLGLIAIWTNKSRLLKELAYAGFAIDFCMASISHGLAGDGAAGIIAPLFALSLAGISFIYHRKLFVTEEQEKVIA